MHSGEVNRRAERECDRKTDECSDSSHQPLDELPVNRKVLTEARTSGLNVRELLIKAIEDKNTDGRPPSLSIQQKYERNTLAGDT